ncbi:MAG: rhomboid family intramembrane serine protease [Fuerstiella sp.]
MTLRMGLYNADLTGPADRTPQNRPTRTVTTRLILVTAGIFLLQLVTLPQNGSSPITEWLGLDRELLFRSGHVWRLLTYAFCHSEQHLMHVACNMLALFFLGRIVAQTVGQREFLWFYLVAAVFSGMVQATSLAAFSADPTLVLGASGAVSAVFMLFALHYPRLKLLLFGVIPIEARWLLAAVVAYDGLGFLGLAPSIFVPEGSSVGHAAHLGGLVFGLLYFRWNMNLTRWWDRFAGRVRAAELPRHNLKIYNPTTQPELELSGKVDRILAKISREGEASLTPRERRILSQASEHLKSTR